MKKFNGFTLSEGATHAALFNKSFGFTLSEVLVTLGILGIVAALTTPTLVANYQKKAFATKIRKVTNYFTEAVDMYITEQEKTHLGLTKAFTVEGEFDNFVTSKFNVVKSCENNNCFGARYASIDGTKSAEFSCTNGVAYTLADSTAVCMIPDEDTSSIKVYADLNGPDGPNMGGRDMFRFIIESNATLSKVIELEVRPKKCDPGTPCPAVMEKYRPKCTEKPLGEPCVLTLMDNNWKMNY